MTSEVERLKAELAFHRGEVKVVPEIGTAWKRKPGTDCEGMVCEVERIDSDGIVHMTRLDKGGWASTSLGVFHLHWMPEAVDVSPGRIRDRDQAVAMYGVNQPGVG